jgi:hypothetical protein
MGSFTAITPNSYTLVGGPINDLNLTESLHNMLTTAIPTKTKPPYSQFSGESADFSEFSFSFSLDMIDGMDIAGDRFHPNLVNNIFVITDHLDVNHQRQSKIIQQVGALDATICRTPPEATSGISDELDIIIEELQRCCSQIRDHNGRLQQIEKVLSKAVGRFNCY